MEESLEKFFYKYKNVFDSNVISYVRDFIDVIDENQDINRFFQTNNIPIIYFANEMCSVSQLKMVVFEDFKLTQEEINQVVQNVLFSNIICQLIEEEHVEISAVSKYGTLEYTLDDYAVEYFKKIGLDLSNID